MEYGRRHGEPHRAIKELKESVLSCRSREAVATSRVSLLRELASAGNSASLDVAPSYSRGWNENSLTGPNAPLELVQSDFAFSASDETKKLEPTFGTFRIPVFFKGDGSAAERWAWQRVPW